MRMNIFMTTINQKKYGAPASKDNGAPASSRALSLFASAIGVPRLFLTRAPGLLLFFLGIGLLLAGCSKDEEEADSQVPVPDSGAGTEMTEVMPAPSAAEDKLRPVDAEEYRKVLSEHQGQIIVVDFWATWCPPCVESFPKLVAFHSEYRDKGVVVIGASVDFPGTEAEVKEFIEEHNAEFQNLFVETDNMDSFITSVSSDWGGGVPAVFVYDRTGEPAGQYAGSAAIDEAKNKVDTLLD